MRVPVRHRSTWDSEEDEETRKGRGCMLQYQSSLLRILTPFMAQSSSEMSPDPLTGKVPLDYFLGSNWLVKKLLINRKGARM